jgi:hypothetical protein
MFFPGSFVKQETYTSTLNNIHEKLFQKQIYTDISIENYLPLKHIHEDTIIICHSFGSYFGLLNCIKNANNDHIKGCILINGHFNQRNKMLYSGIEMQSVRPPVLTILCHNDDKLPFQKALDDLFVKYENRISDKYFVLNPGDHLSSFQNDTLMENQIVSFIENIHERRNFSYFENMTRELYQKSNWQLNNTVYYSECEFKAFLKSKPFSHNHLLQTTDYILLKTKNVDIEEWIRTEYSEKPLVIKKNYLPFGENCNKYEMIRKSFFWYTLSNWLLYSPKIQQFTDYVEMEILVIPVKDDIVYYKIPNKFLL